MCFCFTLTILFMHTMFTLKQTLFIKRYRTHYKVWSDLDTFGSDSIFVKNIYA